MIPGVTSTPSPSVTLPPFKSFCKSRGLESSGAKIQKDFRIYFGTLNLATLTDEVKSYITEGRDAEDDEGEWILSHEDSFVRPLTVWSERVKRAFWFHVRDILLDEYISRSSDRSMLREWCSMSVHVSRRGPVPRRPSWRR